MAGKQTQYASLVVILGIVLIGFLFLGSQVTESAFLSGVGALSVSPITLIDNYKDLESPVWLITVSPSTSGTRFHAVTINPEDTEQSDGSKTEEDAIIEIDLNNEQCVYPLEKESNARKLTKYAIKEWSNYRCGTPLVTESYMRTTAVDTYGIDETVLVAYGSFGYYTKSDTCFVIYKSSEASVTGTLDASYVRILGNIFLTIDGIVDEFELDTEESYNDATSSSTITSTTEGMLGDNAYVEWRGNLLNKNCDDLDGYRGAYYNNAWRVISDDLYDDYKNQQDIFLDNLDEISGYGSAVDKDDVSALVSSINTYYSTALSSKISSITNGAIDQSSSLTNGKLRVEHEDLLQSPVISIYVEADYIGLEIPETDGEIVSVTSETFDADEEGKIVVKVKNTGEVDASYKLVAECEDPFSSNSQTVGLEVGETDSFDLSVNTAGVDDGTCSNCYVALISQGETLDQKAVEVCADPVYTCSDDYCSIENGQEVVYSCSSSGEEYVKEICGVGETCENAVCIVEESSVGAGDETNCTDSYWSFFKEDCDVCDSKLGTTSALSTYCKTKEIDFSLIYGIIIGLGVAIFAFIVVSLRFRSARPEIRVATYLLAIILGIIAGIFSSIIIEHWIISTIVIVLILGVIVGIKTVLARFGLA